MPALAPRVGAAAARPMRAAQAARQRSPCSEDDSQDLLEQWAECDRIRAFSSWVVFCYHAAHHTSLLEAACTWHTRRALLDTLRAWRRWASSQPACLTTPRLWTPSRGTNAEIGRLLLDVSERRQAALRLLGRSEALHGEEGAASNGSPGLHVASRLAEKGRGEAPPPLSPPEVIVQRLWGDARRDLEQRRGHGRQEGAWEASEGLEEAPSPLSPPEAPPPIAAGETRRKLALSPGTPSAASLALRPGLSGAPSCPTCAPHSASATRRPRPEDAHCRHRADNAARRLRQQQRARSAERREAQLAAAEREERCGTEAARWRQLMAAREEARRPARGREAVIQVERRRAKALRAMRDLVSREARLPRAALVSLPSFASTPRGVPVPTRSLPASLPPYRWTACAAPLPAYCCSVTLAAASPATRCSASAADGCSWPCVRSKRPGRRELASRCLSRCRARPRGLAS